MRLYQSETVKVVLEYSKYSISNIIHLFIYIFNLEIFDRNNNRKSSLISLSKLSFFLQKEDE